MAFRTSLEEALALPETFVQQSIFQQAQAAAAAQTSPTGATAEVVALQGADLLDPETTDDEMPPPAYGDDSREIQNEKGGLGTNVEVTDDGRVNIRINHFNRRISQIFSPALRQQVQDIRDSRPPPPAYIPPSLAGKEGAPFPPSLNVVIQVVGSRGDVQPFVALGKVLKDTYGHRVRLATHPTFKRFVLENGLEFFSIGGDPSRLMAFMVKNPSLVPGFRSVMSGDVGRRRRDVAEYIQGCWRSCYESGDGMGLETSDDELTDRPFVADCIIANPPSFAHIHCAEKLGIPLHIMFTMPYSPTQAFPHPLANIQSTTTDPQLTNYISYTLIDILLWQSLGDIINRFRAKCLCLDPVSLTWAPGMLQRLKVPHTYCWPPALIPKPADWGPHISISGFQFLNQASNYTPARDLQAFLDEGPAPVYVGFGSIVLDDPKAITKLIFEAARKTGQRVLLAKGWGGIGAHGLHIPGGVFILDNVPHDWLFNHVSCVVHHGGAGTTAAGIAAGCPTVVVPFFGDQPFWGTMVARAGAGPDPIPHRQLTADKLADAINFCLRPESLERARTLASKMEAERGSETAAQSFHQFLDVDRLRCTLAPSRAAAWRIRRTNIRLSTFAACTLANANLLDFKDLKLFRAQEYETDEGPWDPISGGFVAACGAFGGMAMGLADFPSETVKAVQRPFRRNKGHPRPSTSAIASKKETSSVEARSASVKSPEGSQTSLDVQTAPPGMSSTLPSPTNHDMLRHTGVHKSKGLGRFAKALVQSPMDVSMGLTKGLHNMPKHWNDETVRPQAQVSDFKSGARAAGKGFGLGWYDGVTGLVTQPWRGAQDEGVSGLFKGIGRGMAGFITKPGAGSVGILGYMMKGVHKEMQKLYGGSVQSHIVASRTVQGYEEWLRSSDAEKDEVIVQWRMIQKYVKGKGKAEEIVRDVLEEQRKLNTGDGNSRQDSGSPSAAALLTDGHSSNHESAMPSSSCPQFPRESVDTPDLSQSARRPPLSDRRSSLGHHAR